MRARRVKRGQLYYIFLFRLKVVASANLTVTKVACPRLFFGPRRLAVDQPHAGQHQDDACHLSESDLLAEEERR